MLNKLFSARWWSLYLGIAALCLVAVLVIFSPQQVSVVLYKAALVLLAALLGNIVSVVFCPYARLTSYLVDDWRKNPDADGGSDVDYPIVEGYAGVFAAALVYRAVVVGAVTLAFCLGL